MNLWFDGWIGYRMDFEFSSNSWKHLKWSMEMSLLLKLILLIRTRYFMMKILLEKKIRRDLSLLLLEPKLYSVKMDCVGKQS